MIRSRPALDSCANMPSSASNNGFDSRLEKRRKRSPAAGGTKAAT
jgi:hypothetical protein